MKKHVQKSCIIIGAGMTGLSAASVLQEHGIKTTVMDRSSIAGGRMSTRRFGGGVFDVGAQFITVQSSEFKKEIQQWIEVGVARAWDHNKWKDAEMNSSNIDAIYIGAKGMRSIVKYLSSGLEIRRNHDVIGIKLRKHQWEVKTNGGTTISADSIIATIPAPLMSNVLVDSRIQTPTSESEALHSIEYLPCFALMVNLNGPSSIPHSGLVPLAGEPISWISDNTQKGISSVGYCLTIIAGTDFSMMHVNHPSNEVAHMLLRASHDWLGSKVLNYNLHLWEHGHPVKVINKSHLVIYENPPLFYAGDAFNGSRLEGAYLSGKAAARMVLHYLK